MSKRWLILNKRSLKTIFGRTGGIGLSAAGLFAAGITAMEIVCMDAASVYAGWEQQETQAYMGEILELTDGKMILSRVYPGERELYEDETDDNRNGAWEVEEPADEEFLEAQSMQFLYDEYDECTIQITPDTRIRFLTEHDFDHTFEEKSANIFNGNSGQKREQASVFYNDLLGIETELFIDDLKSDQIETGMIVYAVYDQNRLAEEIVIVAGDD